MHFDVGISININHTTNWTIIWPACYAYAACHNC